MTGRSWADRAWAPARRPVIPAGEAAANAERARRLYLDTVLARNGSPEHLAECGRRRDEFLYALTVARQAGVRWPDDGQLPLDDVGRWA